MLERFTIKNRKKGRLIIAALVLFVLVVSMLSLDLNVVKPYALTADGVKTDKAYSVTVDGEEVGVVASREDGSKLVSQIEDFYVADDADVTDVEILQDVDIKRIHLKLGAHVDHPQIDDMDALFRYVMTGDTEGVVTAEEPEIVTASAVSINDGKAVKESDTDPLVDVRTTENVSYRQVVEYKTIYKTTSKLDQGEEKVEKKGVDGEKTVKAAVTKVNGEITGKKILSSKVTKKPVDKVVLKGTKVNGNKVVAYAKKFLGNPYVYGGSSLTNGTDCSGFTMSVYAHFGVGLPHNSDAQNACGRSVSYSEAEPGDLIIYPGHVGMYIGNGQIIHAAGVGQGITIGNARHKTIIGIRRVI